MSGVVEMKYLKHVLKKTAPISACLSDRRGSISVFYALAFIGLIGFAALSIDGSRAHLLRSQLSFAADVASLAISHEANGMTDEELTEMARMYVEANLSPSFLGATAITGENLMVTARKGTAWNTVEVYATAVLTTALLGVVDGDLTVSISADSSAQREGRPGELILVLDRSGSMDARMKEEGLKKHEVLENGVNRLFDYLYGADDTIPGLYVGIIPASGYVNIEPHEEWIGDDNWTDPFGDWLTLQGYTFDPEEDTTKFVNTTAGLQNETWCSGIRDFKDHTWGIDDTPPSEAPIEVYFDFRRGIGGGGHEYSIEIGDCDNERILPLTASRSVLSAKIANFKHRGPQRSDFAVAWGWRAMSPDWRGLWGEPALPRDWGEEDHQKTMIIMISALNNFGPDENADGHLVAQCDALKALGVDIYTVPFDLPPRALWLYEDCASGPDYFYPAGSDQDLTNAFQTISGRISKLKLIPTAGE